MLVLWPLVYLRTTPEVVYERMKVRGRSEESTVDLGYLKQLHDLHEDWLIHGRKDRPAPVSIAFFLLHHYPHCISNDPLIYFNQLLFFLKFKVLVLDADLDMDKICEEYVRSESSILRSNTQFISQNWSFARFLRSMTLAWKRHRKRFTSSV